MRARITIAIALQIVVANFVYSGADDWTQRNPSGGPPSARNGHAMAFVGDDQVLLFGGENSGTAYNDTWIYDVSADSWTLMSPTGGPPPARWYHALAYVGGDQALLFGGSDLSTRYGDTWVYDLSTNTWTEITPAGSSPSLRSGHAMVALGGGQALLFGGYDGSTGYGDTWIYDVSANTWTQMSPAGGPPAARYAHAMTFLGGGHVLLFGGECGVGVHCSDGTWLYGLPADTWTQMSPTGGPPSDRILFAMAYLGGDQALLFGGYDTALNNETWVYDLSANTWTQDANTLTPGARDGHAMVESGPFGASLVMLFGGWEASGYSAETWAFGGGDYPLPLFSDGLESGDTTAWSEAVP